MEITKRWEVLNSRSWENNSPHLLINLSEQTTDVLILDENMLGINKVECRLIITDKFPKVKIILLTAINKMTHLNKISRSGVTGFVHHNTTGLDFQEAITTVMQGKNYFCPLIMLNLIDKKQLSLSEIKESANLNDNEFRIFDHMMQNISRKETACLLGICDETVKEYRSKVHIKLNNAGLLYILDNLNK